MLEHWKDHFHPHEGNDHRPHAYRAVGAVALSLVVLSIVAFTSLQSHYITHSEHFLSAVLPAVLVDLANEDREKEGLSALTSNETLAQAAQMKADHMAEHEYFAHDAPDGTTPWEWFAQAGYEYELAGENLAINFSDSKDVEEAWMNSPLHRENILEEGFTEVGIATAKGEYEGDDTVYVVQMFARPSSAELAERETDAMIQGDSTDTDITTSEPEEEPVEEPTVADADTTSQPEPDPEPEPIAQASTPESESEPDLEPEPEPEPTPEPEPEPAPTAEPTPSGAATTGPATTTDTETESATPTLVATTFATPTPMAQVQGESGIALNPFGSDIGRQASQMAHLLSQPEFLFRTLMLTLFALIALSLLISVGVEAKRHHVPQALKSLGALVMLLLVFYLGINFIFKDPAVATEKLTEISAEVLVDQSDSRLLAEMSVSGSILES